MTDLLTANQNSCPTVAVEILYNGLLGLVEGGGGTGLALRGEETAVLQNVTALMSPAQTYKEMDSHLEAAIYVFPHQSITCCRVN